MHMTYRNVNDAFNDIVKGIYNGSIGTYPRKSGRDSAQGDTLTIEEPLLITYLRPWERVLFNPARDANPFFSMYESMWMLAGRNDVAPLEYYNSNIGNIASDDGKIFNGAYGYRWRKANYERHSEVYDGDATSAETWETSDDQLKILIQHLKQNPDSRRAVLQMWDTENDLLKIGSSKDVCCNLSVMFSIRTEQVLDSHQTTTGKPGFKTWLDMTVTNRSNDIIWGLLGANYVHFSFLQEYMAAHLGVPIGRYHHFSNNAHVYLNNWKPEEWLREASNPYEWGTSTTPFATEFEIRAGRRKLETLDEEISSFVERHQRDAMAEPYSERFLECVAQPMCVAYHWYKRKHYDRALDVVQSIEAEDWRVACRAWIERRKK